uniref:Putative secreted protein n=1 Tax=Anopheles darlingi TaxID=43151 RepID=A0A2M4DIJ1_ANODA
MKGRSLSVRIFPFLFITCRLVDGYQLSQCEMGCTGNGDVHRDEGVGPTRHYRCRCLPFAEWKYGAA